MSSLLISSWPSSCLIFSTRIFGSRRDRIFKSRIREILSFWTRVSTFSSKKTRSMFYSGLITHLWRKTSIGMVPAQRQSYLWKMTDSRFISYALKGLKALIYIFMLVAGSANVCLYPELRSLPLGVRPVSRLALSRVRGLRVREAAAFLVLVPFCVVFKRP